MQRDSLGRGQGYPSSAFQKCSVELQFCKMQPHKGFSLRRGGIGLGDPRTYDPSLEGLGAPSHPGPCGPAGVLTSECARSPVLCSPLCSERLKRSSALLSYHKTSAAGFQMWEIPQDKIKT